jgi:nucleoside-diphosphate-sugar epimerase
MSVLVTGASGFIGLNIVEALLERGDDVVAFSDTTIPGRARAAFGALRGRCIEATGDVRDQRSVTALFETHSPRTVVHAAALTPGPQTERAMTAATVEVNVLGTVRILEAAARDWVERVVLLSSAAVYGESGFGAEPLDEAQTPARPLTTYGVTKYAAERLGLRFAEKTGLPVVAARLAAAFGPWERDTGVRETLSPFYQALRIARRGGEMMVARRAALDWIYSRDAAGAILALLDRRATEPVLVNVSPGFRTEFGAFCDALAGRHAGFRWRVAPGEDATVDLHGARDRTPLATTRLRHDVGWSPRFDAESAFRDYFDWVERHGGPD